MSLKIYALPTGTCFTKVSMVLGYWDQMPDEDKEKRNIKFWGKGDRGYNKNMKLYDGVYPGIALCTYVYYIEGTKYKILVDTGYDSDENVNKALRRHLVPDQIFYRKPSEDVVKQLATINIHPDDIDIVILSHCHFDHYHNVGLFKNAKFICNATELDWALCPPHYGSWYYEEYKHYLEDVLHRIELVRGDEWIMDGIQVWELGGHSPAQMAIVIDTNIGRVGLGSDLVLTYENIELKWPGGTVFDLPDMMAGYNRLLCETDIVVPGHDYQVLERFPKGIIG